MLPKKDRWHNQDPYTRLATVQTVNIAFHAFVCGYKAVNADIAMGDIARAFIKRYNITEKTPHHFVMNYNVTDRIIKELISE